MEFFSRRKEDHPYYLIRPPVDSIISNPEHEDMEIAEISDELNEISDELKEISDELKEISDEMNEISDVDVEPELDPSMEYIDTRNVPPLNDRFYAADSLYQEISEQIEKVQSAIMSNGDRTEQMQYEVIENEPHQLELASIAGDASCMFGAIVHQLFGFQINSDEHRQATSQLRQDVCQYIPEHFKSFVAALQDRVSDIDHLQQMEDIYEAQLIFVDDYLTSEDVWGGQETIQAVHEMFRVNIFVFREPRDYSLFHREPNRRILLLAHRKGDRSKPLSLHRYDSVCNIDRDEIWDIIQHLLERHMRN